MSWDRQPCSGPNLVHVLGWLVGGLSVLSLTGNFTPLQLLDVYGALVDSVCGFLFSWIDWLWISIGPAENHLLVILLILVSAAARANPHFDRAIGLRQELRGPFFVYFTVFVIPVFLLFLMLPGVLALIPALLWMATPIFGFGAMRQGHEATGERIAFGPFLAAELLGIIGLVLALMALSVALSSVG